MPVDPIEVEPVEDEDVEATGPASESVGVAAVTSALRLSGRQMGIRRSVKTLVKVNHADGFDCPSCAWPDPDPESRKLAEFCENGARAVAWEATRKQVGRDFFSGHSIEELRSRSDMWLEEQGRLVEPMHLAPGSEHYRPIPWDDAFSLAADRLRSLEHPDRAAFYTSGRASNEAAFVYQLLARRLGTNNLPDCSNMCHESSGAALSETVGIGKGCVSLQDIEDHADMIMVVGQNPGTCHPRMLTSLEKAKRRGASIIAVNPLPEAGLGRFRNPQTPRGLLGRGTMLADEHLAVRVNGDLALFAGLNKALVEMDTQAGGVLDTEFIDRYCDGFDVTRRAWQDLDWEQIETQSGIDRSAIYSLARRVASCPAVTVCWAMGLTQHKNAVATIQEIVNFLLLRGNIGRPGAGPAPIRGHSNVQGDRTMGIWERMPDAFLDALGREFGFDPPRKVGFDTVETIRAMRDGLIDVFFALGGNFVAATPDTDVTANAMANCSLTVHVATKLNRSHLYHGREALILPCLGRSERDVSEAGDQFVTVEDSMSVVHSSRGSVEPVSPQLRSEVAIVCSVAEKLFGAEIEWGEMARDYRIIRSHISRVVPGFHAFEPRVTKPGGFVLPRPPADSRTFPTATGKARFTVNSPSVPHVPEGHLLLQTVRSHDQFNTTVYGLADRYRGISGGRRVVFVNRSDLDAAQLRDGETVDIVSVWSDHERRARRFRVVEYPTPRGCAATYFPEANVLVPLDATADVSNTPVSKSIVVRLERSPRADSLSAPRL
ncbi:MAG: FdhF/YdeP family oxidoreductase [Acidimicrobiales bacterium]